MNDKQIIYAQNLFNSKEIKLNDYITDKMIPITTPYVTKEFYETQFRMPWQDLIVNKGQADEYTLTFEDYALPASSLINANQNSAIQRVGGTYSLEFYDSNIGRWTLIGNANGTSILNSYSKNEIMMAICYQIKTWRDNNIPRWAVIRSGTNFAGPVNNKQSPFIYQHVNEPIDPLAQQHLRASLVQLIAQDLTFNILLDPTQYVQFKDLTTTNTKFTVPAISGYQNLDSWIIYIESQMGTQSDAFVKVVGTVDINNVQYTLTRPSNFFVSQTDASSGDPLTYIYSGLFYANDPTIAVSAVALLVNSATYNPTTLTLSIINYRVVIDTDNNKTDVLQLKDSTLESKNGTDTNQAQVNQNGSFYDKEQDNRFDILEDGFNPLNANLADGQFGFNVNGAPSILGPSGSQTIGFEDLETTFYENITLDTGLRMTLKENAAIYANTGTGRILFNQAYNNNPFFVSNGISPSLFAFDENNIPTIALTGQTQRYIFESTGLNINTLQIKGIGNQTNLTPLDYAASIGYVNVQNQEQDVVLEDHNVRLITLENALSSRVDLLTKPVNNTLISSTTIYTSIPQVSPLGSPIVVGGKIVIPSTAIIGTLIDIVGTLDFGSGNISNGNIRLYNETANVPVGPGINFNSQGSASLTGQIIVMATGTTPLAQQVRPGDVLRVECIKTGGTDFTIFTTSTVLWKSDSGAVSNIVDTDNLRSINLTTISNVTPFLINLGWSNGSTGTSIFKTLAENQNALNREKGGLDISNIWTSTNTFNQTVTFNVNTTFNGNINQAANQSAFLGNTISSGYVLANNFLLQPDGNIYSQVGGNRLYFNSNGEIWIGQSTGTNNWVCQFKFNEIAALKPLNMNSNRIQNVGAPVLDGDASNKLYVDNNKVPFRKFGSYSGISASITLDGLVNGFDGLMDLEQVIVYNNESYIIKLTMYEAPASYWYGVVGDRRIKISWTLVGNIITARIDDNFQGLGIGNFHVKYLRNV